MNFYQAKFHNGKSYEFKSGNDEQAIKRAQSLILRWNQPTAMVSRTNPFNATFKNELAFLENPDFNPDKPILDKDPAELYHRPAPAKKKERKTREGRASTKASAGPRITHEVTLKEVADKVGIDPAVIRRKLRSSKVDKPEGGWGWSTWEDDTIKLIESWYKGS